MCTAALQKEGYIREAVIRKTRLVRLGSERLGRLPVSKRKVNVYGQLKQETFVDEAEQ